MDDTDRKLLELAAKAFGLHFNGWVGDRMKYYDPSSDWVGSDWNPLEDDAKALRLAVKLEMHLCLFASSVQAEIIPLAEESSIVADEQVSVNMDAYAATRRAIVRAAASLAGTRGGEK